MYLIYFDLNLFLFRTLAQRAAKRAKVPVVIIEDEPTEATGGGGARDHLAKPGNYSAKQPPAQPLA